MTKTLAVVLVFLGGLMVLAARRNGSSSDQATSPNPGLLVRHYQEGERLSYRMTATNTDNISTKRYEAQADGVVKKDFAGNFYEKYQWFGVVWDGKAVAVPPDFRQILSLDPRFKPVFPDLRKVSPGLVGPVLDLMTFYVDLTMAIRHGLDHAGDHVYVKFGRPSSWAAGEGAILGESSIDFDITLQDVNRSANTATVLIRHVPPAQSQVQLPAIWMRTPVVDTPNNWVNVKKDHNGEYIAAVGKETFDVVIKTSLADGRILSATMDNPVEVLERQCEDAALSVCGDPIRYQIRRQIAIR
jgi:hypothetical protein